MGMIQDGRRIFDAPFPNEVVFPERDMKEIFVLLGCAWSSVGIASGAANDAARGLRSFSGGVKCRSWCVATHPTTDGRFQGQSITNRRRSILRIRPPDDDLAVEQGLPQRLDGRLDPVRVHGHYRRTTAGRTGDPTVPGWSRWAGLALLHPTSLAAEQSQSSSSHDPDSVARRPRHGLHVHVRRYATSARIAMRFG